MADQDPDLTYQSIKTYTHAHGYSCCFRQWRADSHCAVLHGYSLQIELTFEGDLDHRNWVQDFGGLKPVKAFLDETFDHKTIIAEDDPCLDAIHMFNASTRMMDIVVLPAVGCEKFAEYIYHEMRTRFECGDKLKSVKVSEHPGNAALVTRK